MSKKFSEKLLLFSKLISHKPSNFRVSHRMSTKSYLANLNPNSPMDTSPIPAKQQDVEIQSKAHKLCSDHLGGTWSTISPFQLSVMPISGGMSNAIYCCSLPSSISVSDGEPAQVLLRLYGDQSTSCDISIQLEIFSLLSVRGLGPKLYGKFEGGRLEEFLFATSLSSEELMNSEISSIIATKLANIHNLNVPIDKSKTWLAEKYDEWTKFIQEEMLTTKYTLDLQASQSTIDVANELLAIDFNKEIEFVLDAIDKTSSPIVFSHNDLHQGNILLAKYSKRRPTLGERIFLIDFEYCSYNYRAYDIANHFCEWCFEYDTPDYPHFKLYEDRFPSLDARRNFVHHYAEQHRQLEKVSSTSDKNNNDNSTVIIASSNRFNCDKNGHCNDGHNMTNGLPRYHANGHSNGINGKQTLEDIILDEIKPFIIGANLLWTLWCIKSAKSSTIKFGYWEHAMARWKLYSKFKIAYANEKEF